MTPAFKLVLVFVVAIIASCVLTGCAGLSINFDAAVTYRSDVPIGERKP